MKALPTEEEAQTITPAKNKWRHLVKHPDANMKTRLKE